MEAIRLTSPGLDGLGLETVDTPSLRPGEALVAVHAAAITRDELEWPLDRLPAVPSYELSGVVAAVADDVDTVSVGDEVYALTPFDRDGVAADFTVLPEDLLVRRPPALGDAESAAIPLPALTAWQGLFDHGALRAGERVLITGATGKQEAVAAQLARDLRLVLRGFSSAVYAAAGVSSLFVLLLVALLVGDALAEREAEGFGGMSWLPSVLAVKFACVLATAALAATVPVLVAHQEPHLWLERSVGLKGEDAWRAKLYLARVVTAPAAVFVWVAGILCGAVPAAYAVPLLAECAWLWWLVSTAAGGLAFELPAQPGLALILVLCAGLAAGGLTAFLWPIGLAIYGFAVQPLCMRGAMRAELHLREQ